MSINGPNGLYLGDSGQDARTRQAQQDAAYWRKVAQSPQQRIEKKVDVTDYTVLDDLKAEMEKIAALELKVCNYQDALFRDLLSMRETSDALADALTAHDRNVRKLTTAFAQIDAASRELCAKAGLQDVYEEELPEADFQDQEFDDISESERQAWAWGENLVRECREHFDWHYARCASEEEAENILINETCRYFRILQALPHDVAVKTLKEKGTELLKAYWGTRPAAKSGVNMEAS